MNIEKKMWSNLLKLNNMINRIIFVPPTPGFLGRLIGEFKWTYIYQWLDVGNVEINALVILSVTVLQKEFVSVWVLYINKIQQAHI